MHRLTSLLATFSLASVILAFTLPPVARAKVPRHHANSLIKTPQYPADFKYFDYVNPDAPKGGTVRLGSIGTFDNLNRFIFKGNLAGGIGLIYDSLMSDSLDEPSTNYALLAEWVSYPEDFSSATFKLREQARWHDGKPVTAEDVIFSMETLKKNHPQYGQYYKNVTSVKKTGDREVTFYFDKKNNRELPHIVGQLPVLPKHYWTGRDADGKPRDPTKSTLAPPLGSGPYRLKDIKPGRSIIYERVKDYWGKDLPVNRGQNNFDEIRIEYFRDQLVLFEAFKKGQIDFHTENSSKNWATGYDFAAVNNGLIKLDKIFLKTSQPMQGFIFNTRRKKFKDPRVRRAFNLAFDFEWANKNLFFSQYTRTSSYFANTELASSGLPAGRELEILNEVKDLVPPEVFTTEFKNPVNNSRDDTRKHIREALALLKEAGWTIRNEIVSADADCGMWCKLLLKVGLRSRKTEPVLKNAAGETMEVEFLIVSPLFQRIILPYVSSLKRLGIVGKVRLVDSAQYARRIDNYEFDFVVSGFRQSESPGNEQRGFWGSAAADKPGSRNLIGIKNKAVDKLIDRIIFAKNRSELVAATRALDRVLLWNHYVVPQWHVPYERVAYWDRYAHPVKLPSQDVGFLTVWWQDKTKAAKLAAARK